MYWCVVWPLRVQSWQDLWLDLQIFYLSIHFSSREITQCFTDPVWLSRGSQFAAASQSMSDASLCPFLPLFQSSPHHHQRRRVFMITFSGHVFISVGKWTRGFNNMQVGSRTLSTCYWLLRDKSVPSWKAMEVVSGNRKDKLKTVRPNGIHGNKKKY